MDAQRSIEFEKPVTVAGTGALTLITNDGGSDGDYWFDAGASVSFWDTSSSLVINGQSFTLVKDIKTLAADIAANPSGDFALANNYDASVDGTYSLAVVTTPFFGAFEGMGHVVSKLSVSVNEGHVFAGMFSRVSGLIRDLDLSEVTIVARGTQTVAGTLVGQIDQNSEVMRAHATGTITGYSYLGGLVGANEGTVSLCSADVTVTLVKHALFAGGLVGANGGGIIRSYASGDVSAPKNFHHGGAHGGRLVGTNDGFGDHGAISQSYATGAVQSGAALGGLAGSDSTGAFSEVYAVGLIGNGFYLGGLVGDNFGGDFVNSYWDVTTTGQSVGCGPDIYSGCDAAVGLTDAQLKSALPTGFDPKVWGQDANINNGYPYLLANPPPKDAPAKVRAKSPARAAAIIKRRAATPTMK